VSYVRFGEDGSDVYVFRTMVGDVEMFECCWCSFVGEEALSWAFRTVTAATMVDHLRSHVDGGETVPGWVLEDLAAGVPS
jgi:hypothetical protein